MVSGRIWEFGRVLRTEHVGRTTCVEMKEEALVVIKARSATLCAAMAIEAYVCACLFGFDVS